MPNIINALGVKTYEAQGVQSRCADAEVTNATLAEIRSMLENDPSKNDRPRSAGGPSELRKSTGLERTSSNMERVPSNVHKSDSDEEEAGNKNVDHAMARLAEPKSVHSPRRGGEFQGRLGAPFGSKSDRFSFADGCGRPAD